MMKVWAIPIVDSDRLLVCRNRLTKESNHWALFPATAISVIIPVAFTFKMEVVISWQMMISYLIILLLLLEPTNGLPIDNEVGSIKIVFIFKSRGIFLYIEFSLFFFADLPLVNDNPYLFNLIVGQGSVDRCQWKSLHSV